MKTNERRSPSELRDMFGANLRELAKAYPSISELSRQLGINRTQFNRYLSGESFPRPDVLARICDFFAVDARVLLEPVGSIGRNDNPLSGPFLRAFLGEGFKDVPEDAFRSGFYQFSRRSFLDPSRFVLGLFHVSREYETTFIRGFDARAAMREPLGRAAGDGERDARPRVGRRAGHHRGLRLRHVSVALLRGPDAVPARRLRLRRLTVFLRG